MAYLTVVIRLRVIVTCRPGVVSRDIPGVVVPCLGGMAFASHVPRYYSL